MARRRTARVGRLWSSVRDSFWFVPALCAACALALAAVAVRIHVPEDAGTVRDWLYGGGVEGARGVLAVIAGSLITVTGTVFSVTIVAMQLASSQFTPRVLRTFVADRVNQGVLGVMIGTFTYTLLVLRSIRGAEEGQPFVPHVGVTIAIGLLLVSVAALILFIDRAARWVQAPVILQRQALQTLERINALFPERVGRSAAAEPAPEPPPGKPALVRAATSGYLQALQDRSLWDLDADAEGHPGGITLRMLLQVGEFVVEGRPIAALWPAEALDDDVAETVRTAFVLGPERTPEQDVEYGFIALSDIAVRALSPGVNDPTTALHAIDRLTELLAALDARRAPSPLRTSPSGSTRLLVRTPSFERVLGLAFDQVRHFGAGNPAVARRLVGALRELAESGSDDARRAIPAHAAAVVQAARRAGVDGADLATVEELAARVREALRPAA